jgi:hypothetical protein
MKGADSGTIRVVRFCCRNHLLLFKEALMEHNRKIDVRRKALRDKAN